MLVCVAPSNLLTSQVTATPSAKLISNVAVSLVNKLAFKFISHSCNESIRNSTTFLSCKIIYQDIGVCKIALDMMLMSIGLLFKISSI